MKFSHILNCGVWFTLDHNVYQLNDTSIRNKVKYFQKHDHKNQPSMMISKLQKNQLLFLVFIHFSDNIPKRHNNNNNNNTKERTLDKRASPKKRAAV